MSMVSDADYLRPHCRQCLAFVKPIRARTAACRSWGGTFEAKRWMVVASWTYCFALLSLTLSLALMIACPLDLVGWKWWVGLMVASALIVPLVKIGGRLGTMVGDIVANKCGPMPREKEV